MGIDTGINDSQEVSDRERRGHIIQELLHRIKILKIMERGALYEAKFFHLPYGEESDKCGFLFKVDEYGNQGIGVKLLATEWEGMETNRLYFQEAYLDIIDIKRVNARDLPLYVGWVVKTKLFSEALKGMEPAGFQEP